MSNGHCNYDDDINGTKARKKAKRQRSADGENIMHSASHSSESRNSRRMCDWNGNGQIELGMRCGFMSRDRYMDSYEYRRKEIYRGQLRWNIESIMKRSYANDFSLMNNSNNSICDSNSLQVIDIRNDISNSAVTPFITQSQGVKSLFFSRDDKKIIASTTHGSLSK